MRKAPCDPLQTFSYLAVVIRRRCYSVGGPASLLQVCVVRAPARRSLTPRNWTIWVPVPIHCFSQFQFPQRGRQRVILHLLPSALLFFFLTTSSDSLLLRSWPFGCYPGGGVAQAASLYLLQASARFGSHSCASTTFIEPNS